MSTVAMNEDTDYVHTHVINYEPTYLVLMDVVTRWNEDQSNGIADYRDELRAAVESHADAMGLDPEDLSDDVDYAAMIEYEASE
jgi:hypothetical protein